MLSRVSVPVCIFNRAKHRKRKVRQMTLSPEAIDRLEEIAKRLHPVGDGTRGNVSKLVEEWALEAEMPGAK